MNDEIPLDEVEGELDEAKCLRESEEQMRALQQQGWAWQGDGVDKVLAHPDDPDVNIWFHAYSGKQLLSPKLVELIREQARAEQ